jgi:hypothetical protein
MTVAEFAGDFVAAPSPGSDTDGDVASVTRTEIPLSVITQFTQCSLPAPGSSQWIALSDLQRFALIKLSREGHKNEHFLPAVEEFGLLQFATAALVMSSARSEAR